MRVPFLRALLLALLVLLLLAASGLASAQQLRAPSTARLKVESTSQLLQYNFRLSSQWSARVDNPRQDWSLNGKRCLRLRVSPLSFSAQGSPDARQDLRSALAEQGGSSLLFTGSNRQRDTHLYAAGMEGTQLALVSLYRSSFDPLTGLRVYSGLVMRAQTSACSGTRRRAETSELKRLMARTTLSVSPRAR